MKRIFRFLFVAVCTAVLVACSASPASLREQGHEPLNNAQLSNAFSDSTLKWRIPGSVSGTTRYMADGRAVTNWGEGDRAGNWRTEDGELCTRYEGVDGGEATCYTIFRIDGEYRFFVGGELNSTGRIVDSE